MRSWKKALPTGRQVRNWSLVVLALVIFHVFILKVFTGPVKIDFGNDPLINRVQGLLNKEFLYKDRINTQDMYYGSIKGMVESLDDPYTVFLPPEENKTSQENLAGEFGGVGISLGFKDGTLAVMSPLAKTPAEKAGLRAGDFIIKIKDEANGIDVNTADITISKAVELIRGKIGTNVILNIFREGENEPFDVELTRDNIVVASVETEMKESGGKKIAWVKMYKFSERLEEEWSGVVNMIKSEGVDVIVLDLRNNPGGYLDASVMIASDFVTDGAIVWQKSGDGQLIDYEVKKNMGRLVGSKMVVLINEGSASAAEILAGALRQRLGVKLLGKTSFGKGTVQATEEIVGGSGLHVTIAKWLLPDKGEIDGVGVDPDIEIDWNYDESDEQKVFDQLGKLFNMND